MTEDATRAQKIEDWRDQVIREGFLEVVILSQALTCD